MSNNKPIRIEKIRISPKRVLYIKLWGPSPHSKFSMNRASIEIQETKFSDEKQVTYGNPLRIPCDGAAALLSNLISYFIIEGRNLNTEFKEKQENYSDEQKQSTAKSQIGSHDYSEKGIDLQSLLLSEFKGKKLSKTRILKILQERSGIEIESSELLQTLETLVGEAKISKESAIHSASGNNYFLWIFPN